MLTQNIDKILFDLNKYIENLKKENDSYLKTIKEFNEETEIKKLNDKINDLYSRSIGFLNDNQISLARDFAHEHYVKHNGKTEYIIYNTGIGNIIKIKCSKCNEIKDITEDF